MPIDFQHLTKRLFFAVFEVIFTETEKGDNIERNGREFFCLSSKKVWALTIYDTKHSCF